MSVIVKNVTHRFGRQVVLRDVSLEVKEGEIVALLGRSGCGKTTLLNIIASLVKASEGEVRVNGDSPAVAIKKREIGFIFQSPALLKNRTALGNVLLPMEIAGMNGREALKRALATLDLVGLKGEEHKLPWQLSGGMKQRVAIARVFACNYRLILADEPFAALDAVTKRLMAGELLRVWQSTKPRSTILFVTHDEQEGAYLADRIFFMGSCPGTIREVVPVDFSRPRTPSLRKSEGFFQLTSRLLMMYEKEGDSEKP